LKKRARLFKKDFGLCSQTPKRFDEKPETFFARKNHTAGSSVVLNQKMFIVKK
jgi:hypothetical protein